MRLIYFSVLVGVGLLAASEAVYSVVLGPRAGEFRPSQKQVGRFFDTRTFRGNLRLSNLIYTGMKGCSSDAQPVVGIWRTGGVTRALLLLQGPP